MEAEFTAADLASSYLIARSTHDPTILKNLVTIREVRTLAERLEGTYLIRQFAEFVTGLRLFWPTIRVTEPPSRTIHLLDGIAASRRIPDKIREHAHQVREYRDSLIHKRDDPVESIALDESRGHLCRYFSYLPQQW